MEEGTWQQQWMDFANRIAPDECPHETEPDLLHSWIDEVVRAFSEAHHLCHNLVTRMEEHNYG